MNGSYLIRRLILGVLTLFAAVSIVFLMLHMIPGDPVKAILGDMYSETAAQRLNEQLGLNKPVWRQYVDSLLGLLQGDMGTSFANRQPVASEVMNNLWHTIRLAIAAIIITVSVGIPAGIIAALQKGKIADIITMAVSLLGAAMPSFWLGILLMIVFSIQLQWFPLIGSGSGFTGQIQHLVLPAMTLALRGSALTARVTRSSLLEVLDHDYIRTSRAKGLKESIVVRRHALGNALLPVVTVVGVDLGGMLGGSAIVEIVFGRPGLGSLLVNSVLARDFPMIQGAFVTYLAIIILVNLAVDLLYTRLDPRIAYR